MAATPWVGRRSLCPTRSGTPHPKGSRSTNTPDDVTDVVEGTTSMPIGHGPHNHSMG